MKKALSILLSVLFLLTALPLGAVTATAAGAARIYGTLSQSEVVVGETFTLTVSIADNPGMCGWLVHTAYDETAFELVEMSKGTAFSEDGLTLYPNRNPAYGLYVDFISPDVTNNGSMYSCTFRVKDDVAPGNYTFVINTKDPDNLCNLNFDAVPATFENATITVIDGYGGDVNGDGKVNMKDAGLIYQYLCWWDVEVPKNAADVNGDNNINMKDVGLLQQWLTDWEISLSPHSPPEVDMIGHPAGSVTDETSTYVYAVADKTIIQPGYEVNVTISIANNPGLAGWNVGMRFDESAFEVVQLSYGDVFNSDIASGASNLRSCPVYALYNGFNFADETNDGTLYTVCLKVKADAIEGNYNILLGTRNNDPDNFSDQAFNTVPMAFEGTTITVVNPCDPGSHTASQGVVTKAPTCESVGKMTYVCEICGETFTESIPATGEHIYDDGVVTMENTCGHHGAKTYTCTVCDDIYMEFIPATGEHTYVGYVSQEPTCTIGGMTCYRCTRCGNYYYEPIPATGEHIYDSNRDLDCNICGTQREIPFIYGDLSDDGQINTRDLGLFQRYLNGWDVDVVLEACDLDANGKANARDMALLQRYLNGWDVELGVPQ